MQPAGEVPHQPAGRHHPDHGEQGLELEEQARPEAVKPR